MSFDYDYIVIGVGGIGSAAVYWLKRIAPTANVLGLEQFQLGHSRGGSQDYSRIVRKVYMDTKFAEIAEKSFRPWQDIEEESGLKLVHKTGGLVLTPVGSGFEYLLDEFIRSGLQAGSLVQYLNADQIQRQWPQFTTADCASLAGVFDPEAGLVDAAMGIAAHQQCAISRGATIMTGTKVKKLSKLPHGGMKVITNAGEFSCRKVIVTSGAWINQVLASIGVHIPVKISQENVTYFATNHLKDFTKERFPVIMYMDEKHHYYGLPIHGVAGFKLGLDAGGPSTTADTRTFQPDPLREKIAVDFLQKYIPRALGRIIETKTCLYTMTHDRCFLIDTLAQRNHPDVIVCCGAGHAFKFSALFGKILSELAVHGKTDTDLSPFRLNRPAITDRNYQPEFLPPIRENTSSKL